ncbi:unnamed protein product [Caenorhabditis sp. 36 PRJEB53466]|nr:unnamed protein product [Caenorhabditis sp. 36 PRJEB53466]
MCDGHVATISAETEEANGKLSAIIMNSFIILAVLVAIAAAMPTEGGLTGGRSVPHPNSAAGQALANKDLSGSGGLTGGSAVPHPNSAAGQELANKNLEEKSVLEGGTQVKPWLKNQPDLAAIRQNHQSQQ